ncbi:MAG: M1 family metallopeptidase [Gemmatimonadaceae bacterium]
MTNLMFSWTRTLTAKSWLLALLGVPLFPTPAAQTLYMPRAVKQAFSKGTRSPDGRPGPKYWQNRARYSITVTATPPDPTVRGTEQITYLNNSPDSLRNLVIKLFLNIHKPGAPRNGGAIDAYLTSGVHIDNFAVNGQPTPWQDNPRYFTWAPVKLSAPLAPRDSVRLSFGWHYDISRQSNREGMIDSTTYFLAYFYPRVAVYDDYNGWDTMDFTDSQEFYSDFNDYDVSIRVPANYVVWGTGTLLNPAAVLQPEPLKRFQASLTSDQVIHVATKEELAARSVTLQPAIQAAAQPATQQPMNAWHFKVNDIPDVTFALSDHYDWDAASVVVDDATHRRASVQAAYNDTAADYHHMVGFGRHALDWLSHNWPGVPYPYEKTTIVQGFADMEYPMMVNDASTADTTFSRFVVEHEIAHTYFPFYMGINETRYAFMDEGWATTFEYLIGQSDVGADQAATFFKQFRVNRWIADPSPLEDLPIITPGDVLKGVAYGNNAYGKASLGYLAARDLLGDAEFKKSLHAFMDRWHGKHPLPWDFFNTFNDVSGKNLNWFWHNWYFTNNYIDLAVASVAKSGSGYSVVIDNIGGMAAPVDVRMRYTDGSTGTVHETPAIWEFNQQRATVAIPTRKTIQSLDLNGGIWVDADSTNNVWPAGKR